MIFKLVIKNIIQFITRTPLSFFIVLLIEITAYIGVLMTYGVIRNTFSEKEQATLDSRQFSYSRYENGKGFVPWENSDKVLSDFKHLIFEELKDEIDSASVYGYMYYNGDMQMVCFTHFFTNELYYFHDIKYADFLHEDDILCIKEELTDAKLGTVLDIGGRKYKIADREKDVFFGLLFKLENAPSGVDLSSYQIFLKNIPTKSHVEEIKNRLSELFGDEYELILPKIPELRLEQFSNLMLLGCAAAMVFIVISMTKVYMYMLTKRKNWLIVMKLCGCKERKLTAALVFEILLVSGVSFCAGQLIGQDHLIPKMSKYYEAFDYVFSGQSYIVLFLSTLLLTVFISALRVNKYVHKSVKDMRAEGRR